MESEYMALSDAAKEAIFLRRLFASLKFNMSNPLLIQTDSDSALRHIKNNIHHPRTKHINRRHHYIRKFIILAKLMLNTFLQHIKLQIFSRNRLIESSTPALLNYSISNRFQFLFLKLLISGTTALSSFRLQSSASSDISIFLSQKKTSNHVGYGYFTGLNPALYFTCAQAYSIVNPSLTH